MADGLRVWASGPLSPLIICPDANVPDPSGKGYPEGNDVGQFGWDVGMTFSSLSELDDKLSTSISEHGGKKVERLAIDVHGVPGHLDIDGKIGNRPTTAEEIKTKEFGLETFEKYRPQFIRIAQHIAPNGTLIFMSFNVDVGPMGSQILSKLSAEIFREIKVVGFITIGASGQIAVKSCMLPGAKFLGSTQPSGSPEEEARRWLQVKGDPWASEKSPQAKVALNGNIIKNPDGMTPQSGLAGKWSADTGDVNSPHRFVVVFEVAGADTSGKLMTEGWIYWADNDAAPRH